MTGDLLREIEEDIRRDQWKRLWDRYGLVVVIFVLLLILGAGAFAGWRSWRTASAAGQTARLVALGDEAARDPVEAATGLDTLASEMGGAGGGIARLAQAAVLARADRSSDAVSAWERVVADTGLPTSQRELAIILIALNRLYAADPAVLTAHLAPLDRAQGAWRHFAREFLAILADRQGDASRAAMLRASLLTDEGTPAGVRNRVGILQNDVRAEQTP